MNTGAQTQAVMPLQALLRDRRLWRGDSVAPVRAQASGHVALDAVLPGQGWPLGALSEILYTRSGVGELSLVLPLLRQLTQAGTPVAMIRPAHLPYAPALAAAGVALPQLLVVTPQTDADALWSAEQLLHAGAGAVLLWLERIELAASRRLQLAAETGGSIALLLRPATPASLAQGGIAALRLQIERRHGQSQVQVLKCRGMRPPGRYTLGR
jgi:protein ImuA